MKRKLEVESNNYPFGTRRKLEKNESRLNEEYLNKTQVNNSNIFPFPKEIWSLIFSYLSKTDIRCVREVCFQFYLLCFHDQLLKKATFPEVDYTNIVSMKKTLLRDAVKKHLNIETPIHLIFNKSLRNKTIVLDVFKGKLRSPKLDINSYYGSVIVSWKNQELNINFLNFPMRNKKIIHLKNNGLILIQKDIDQLAVLDLDAMEYNSITLPFKIINFIQLQSNEIYVLDDNLLLYHLKLTPDGKLLGAEKITSVEEKSEALELNNGTKLIEVGENKIVCFIYAFEDQGSSEVFFYKIGDPKFIKNDSNCDIRFRYETDVDGFQNFFFLNNLFYNSYNTQDNQNYINVFPVKEDSFGESIEIDITVKFKEILEKNKIETGSYTYVIKTKPLKDSKFVSIGQNYSDAYLIIWSHDLKEIDSTHVHSMIRIQNLELDENYNHDFNIWVKENGNIVLLIFLPGDENIEDDYILQEITFFAPKNSLARYLSSKDQEKASVLNLIKNINTQNLNPIDKVCKFMSDFFSNPQTKYETEETPSEENKKLTDYFGV